MRFTIVTGVWWRCWELQR